MVLISSLSSPWLKSWVVPVCQLFPRRASFLLPFFLDPQLLIHPRLGRPSLTQTVRKILFTPFVESGDILLLGPVYRFRVLTVKLRLRWEISLRRPNRDQLRVALIESTTLAYIVQGLPRVEKGARGEGHRIKRCANGPGIPWSTCYRKSPQGVPIAVAIARTEVWQMSLWG